MAGCCCLFCFPLPETLSGTLCLLSSLPVPASLCSQTAPGAGSQQIPTLQLGLHTESCCPVCSRGVISTWYGHCEDENVQEEFIGRACSTCSIHSSEYTHTKAGPFQELQRFTGQPLLRAHQRTTPPAMSGVRPWAGDAGPRCLTDTPVNSFVQHPLRLTPAGWRLGHRRLHHVTRTAPCQRHASPLSTPRALKAARWHHLSVIFHNPRASPLRSSQWRFPKGAAPRAE